MIAWDALHGALCKVLSSGWPAPPQLPQTAPDAELAAEPIDSGDSSSGSANRASGLCDGIPRHELFPFRFLGRGNQAAPLRVQQT